MFDYHMHSNCSFDGENSMLEMAMAAATRGMKEIAITDHCDVGLRDYDAQKVIDQLEKAREFALIKIVYGIELGDFLLDIAKADEIISQYKFDFVLGSIHTLSTNDDFYFYDYKNKETCYKLLSQYVDEILQFVKWGKFNVLAHMSYPLRYMAGRDGLDVNFDPFESEIVEIFNLMANKGIGLELNVSGLNSEWGQTMPSIKWFKRFKQCGGEIVTVGSDAHSIANAGKSIDCGYDLLKSVGFTHVCTFNERKPTYEKI